MEEWQRNFIDENLVGLLENIIPNGLLLAHLRQKDFLSSEEYNNASVPSVQSLERVRCLLGILKTRVGGYYGFLHALRQTNQTKAVEILESSAPVAILQSQITHNGVKKRLIDWFPALINLDIRKLLKNPKIRDDFIAIFEHGSGKLQIFYHGIPEKYTSKLFVPRHISNRVMVKEEAFQVECKDVFVFKGIRRHQLTNLVRKKCGTSTSSQDILNSKISSQYVLLEADDHWEELQEILDTNVPMHLIHVENSHSCTEFVLLGSTGISMFVQEHIISKRHSAEASVTQDEFVENLLRSEQTQGICICDEPGMGKSWLLANMARKLLGISKTLRIGCFVSIADFVGNLHEEIAADKEDIEVLIRASRDSALSIEIVLFLLKEANLRLECFFDGFDELHDNQRNAADKLLKAFNQLANLRVFVTARPHMRKHLEELLGTTAYDIMPFTTTQQIQYLTGHWEGKLSCANHKNEENQTARLVEFAKCIIQRFPNFKHDSEHSGLGVPLKCFLLAEVYEQLASHYAKMPTVQVDSIATTNHRTYATFLFSKYLDLGLAKSVRATSDKRFKDVLIAHHTRKAMRLISPFFIYDDVDLNHEQIDDLELLAPGFLQKTPTGYEFFHRLFAEFLVAKYFAVAMVTKKLTRQMVTTFFNDFLRYETDWLGANTYTYPISYLSKTAYLKWQKTDPDFRFKQLKSYVFRNTTLITFFNGILENDSVYKMITGNVSQDLSQDVKETVLFRLLIAASRGNYCQVLRFLVCIIEINPFLLAKAKNIFFFETKNAGGYSRSWQLLVTASKYGSKPICEQVTNFLIETMKTGSIFEFMPEWMNTPLHYAVAKGDYGCSEYFQNYISLHDRCLLYYTLNDSIQDSLDVIRSKEEIIRVLVSNNNTLLNESSFHWENGTCLYSGPICVKNAHIGLIKVMIDLKADVLAKDSYSQNVLSNVVRVLSEGPVICRDDFAVHDFFSFLNERVECSVMNDLLQTKYFTKPTSYPTSYYWFQLPLDTIRRIVETPGFDVNQQQYNNGRPLIHLCHYPEITQLLISHGANINEITSGELRNVAHSISKRCRDAEKYFKWTTFMMNTGYSRFWKEKDIDGFTPLELAVITGNVKKECIELIISKTGLDINQRRSGKLSLVQLAAQHGTAVVLKALTAIGADWKQLDGMGRSTLHLSVIGGNNECIEYIIDQGVPISAPDHSGLKPIHLVAETYNFSNAIQATTILLNHGADLLATDSNGNTVAHSVKWDRFNYSNFYAHVVSIGKGELFEIRNNDNLLPYEVQAYLKLQAQEKIFS